MKNGRMVDILVLWRDKGEYFDVWVDGDPRVILENIEGITNVYQSPIEDVPRWTVYIDPRYDRDYIAKEIEAQLKIQMEIE